jgi:hypothetical protein
MANTVKLKRSAVQNKVPTTGDLELGELALNTYDGNLFFKRDVSGSESVVKVATNTNLLSYTRVTSNTTAVTRQAYIADTSGGTFTITLPASPATGDWVTIVDGASFVTTALTVGRNSSTIADAAQDLSLNIEGVSVTLVYDGSTWEVYTQVGAQGGDGSTITSSSTTTFTNKTISGSSNTLSNIANSSLTNSSVTVNGTSISLGGSGTVTAAAGTLTGTTLKSTVVSSSLTSVGTLTDLTVTNTITGSVSGNAGTVTNGVYTTDTGSVTNTMLAGSIANAKLTNSSVTVGTTSISLGSSSTTLGGLTSVTSTSFVGALTGNASTVTNGVYTTDTGTVTNTMLAGSIANAKLANSSVTVNGTSISLGGSGTVTAAAGTLTGTELNSTVVTSSLTSVGTLTGLTTSGAASITYTPGTATGYALTITGKDTIGGTGYFDFFKTTNTTSGVTNGSKSFRINSTGTLEVLNSAYSAVITSLDNSGNLVTAGTIRPAQWEAGQVIKDTMLDNTQFTVNATTVATSTSDTDFITYSYTPVSSSSYLIIHVHVASYDALTGSGGGSDSYFSRIKVGGTEITYGRQATVTTNSFRTGNLFPLTGRYTNASTAAKTITVGVRRDSADDSITITNSATALWMRITEVAR